VLHIGTSSTQTPFLAEKDIPKNQQIVRQTSSISSEAMEMEDRHLAEALSRSEQPQSPQQPLVQSPQRPLIHSQRQSPQQPTQPQSSQAQFREDDIHNIIAAGFSRQQAIEELHRTHGNVQLALASLLARSLKF